MFRRNSTRQTPSRSNSLASDALNSIVSGGNNSPSPSAPSPPPPPPPQLSPSPIGPNDGRKRRVSRSQFDAELQQQLNKLDFYTNVLLSLRTETSLHLSSTTKMVEGMQSLASCIGVGLLDDGDLEDVHDFSVGVNRIEDQRCKELASDLETTVLQPIQQILNLNYSLDLRVQERENMAEDLEKLIKSGEDSTEQEREFAEFNQILKMELGEHLEARKMVLKRSFESLRNGMGCFFSGASRCISKFEDAFGDLPVEGKALSIEAVGKVEDELIEEMIMVTVAVANAEGKMADKEENIRLSMGEEGLNEGKKGLNSSKKKWQKMKSNFVNGKSQLSKGLRRMSGGSKNGGTPQSGKGARRKDSNFNLFGAGDGKPSEQQLGFMKVFNFFGGKNDDESEKKEAKEENDNFLGRITGRKGKSDAVGDLEAEEDLKRRIHALTTGEGGEEFGGEASAEKYVTRGALTKRLSETSMSSELSISSDLSGMSSDVETGLLLKSNDSRDNSRVKLESLFKLVDAQAEARGTEGQEEALFERYFAGGGAGADKMNALKAASSFLNVKELTACRSVSKSWLAALTSDQSIWRRCVRKGGVSEKTRGDFWLWLVYGNSGLIKSRKVKGGGMGFDKVKFGKKYWALIKDVTIAFGQLHDAEGGESSQQPQAGGGSPVREPKGDGFAVTMTPNKLSNNDAPLPSPARRHGLKRRLCLAWVSEIEMDVRRTYNKDESVVITLDSSRNNDLHIDDEDEEDEEEDEEDWDEFVGNEDISRDSGVNVEVVDDAMTKLVNDMVGVGDSEEARSGRSEPGSPQSPKGEVEQEKRVAKRTKLRRILWAYAAYNPRVGYCQGMNMVARALLSICNEDEVKAFWLLAGMIEGYDMSEMWKRGMKQLDFCFFALDNMMGKLLPDLKQHFEGEGILPSMYASRWFVTLFCCSDIIPPKIRLKVLDIFMLEKWGVIFSTSISVLTLVENSCRETDFEGCLKIFSNVKRVLDERDEEEGVWKWLDKSVGEFVIWEKQIRDIQAEYFLESSLDTVDSDGKGINI
ncbi:hypothetical protein TrVE_jg3546 [Triparma verrucosa]|uniref:Rab-GAP TBC domain-containing protein n=1 Tax=Triparma verrucosa TaxID=1606542 RepID=A0A9W7FNM0_9STRA|nr:hypothetical protein TrVE_jg3546 [Triparma verrucosa]